MYTQNWFGGGRQEKLTTCGLWPKLVLEVYVFFPRLCIFKSNGGMKLCQLCVKSIVNEKSALKYIKSTLKTVKTPHFAFSWMSFSRQSHQCKGSIWSQFYGKSLTITFSTGRMTTLYWGRLYEKNNPWLIEAEDYLRRKLSRLRYTSASYVSHEILL